MKIFSDRLKAVRQGRGESQTVFAKRLGLLQPVYARYESGAREPDLAKLCEIATTLEVSADYLLGLSDAAPAGITVTAGDNSQVAIGSNITQAARPPRPGKNRRKTGNQD